MILVQSQQALAQRYHSVRQFTESLCAPLAVEDFVVQTMKDVSPTKWHLAHTAWFFETFLLKKYLPNYKEFHPKYSYMFNSYYNAIGDRHCRAQRGQLSRPTVDEIFKYRHAVDEHMESLLDYENGEVAKLIELGLHHEQQHQELMLTDIKHVFACSPLHPVYTERSSPESHFVRMADVMFDGGAHLIGHDGRGFGYDNEFPCHPEWLSDFRISSRPVTNGEYIEFMNDRGYERPELWLADGWEAVGRNEWRAPYYWDREDGKWFHFTLNGYREVDPFSPVCHVSFYEADAYARWSGSRLPTEQEWEVAARTVPLDGNFVDSGYFRPLSSSAEKGPSLQQMYGDVWEWTASPYIRYPGYRPASGAVGEYNGKFMCNQMVLRGGSCATSRSHIRPTYRNFFYPEQRWQFMGFRLAGDL